MPKSLPPDASDGPRSKEATRGTDLHGPRRSLAAHRPIALSAALSTARPIALSAALSAARRVVLWAALSVSSRVALSAAFCAGLVMAGTPGAGPRSLEGQASTDPASPRALADSLAGAVTGASHRGDIERLRELVRMAGEARAAHPGDPWLRHYRGYALYRLGAAQAARGTTATDTTLARAQEALEASAREDSLPESFALAALAAGMRIAAAPRRRARTLGPRIGEYLRAARTLGPENPRVWLLAGINAFHAPARRGGGPQRARRHLEKACELFGRDREGPPAPGWGRAEIHAWLGRVHTAAGDSSRARAAYRKALEVEPGYRWVREELLPSVEAEER